MATTKRLLSAVVVPNVYFSLEWVVSLILFFSSSFLPFLSPHSHIGNQTKHYINDNILISSYRITCAFHHFDPSQFHRWRVLFPTDNSSTNHHPPPRASSSSSLSSRLPLPPSLSSSNGAAASPTPSPAGLPINPSSPECPLSIPLPLAAPPIAPTPSPNLSTPPSRTSATGTSITLPTSRPRSPTPHHKPFLLPLPSSSSSSFFYEFVISDFSCVDYFIYWNSFRYVSPPAPPRGWSRRCRGSSTTRSSESPTSSFLWKGRLRRLMSLGF